MQVTMVKMSWSVETISWKSVLSYYILLCRAKFPEIKRFLAKFPENLHPLAYQGNLNSNNLWKYCKNFTTVLKHFQTYKLSRVMLTKMNGTTMSVTYYHLLNQWGGALKLRYCKQPWPKIFWPPPKHRFLLKPICTLHKDRSILFPQNFTPKWGFAQKYIPQIL